MLKRVTSMRGPSPRYCACGKHRSFKSLCSGKPTQDLNLRPPASETNASPLDQLAGLAQNKLKFLRFMQVKVDLH